MSAEGLRCTVRARLSGVRRVVISASALRAGSTTWDRDDSTGTVATALGDFKRDHELCLEVGASGDEVHDAAKLIYDRDLFHRVSNRQAVEVFREVGYVKHPDLFARVNGRTRLPPYSVLTEHTIGTWKSTNITAEQKMFRNN